MRFWDSSALVTLVLDQPRTAEARDLHAQDTELVVWWASSIECASAIARLHRDGQLTITEEAQGRALLTTLRASWFEVQPGDAIREQALRILRLHPLRAADSLQLAAALEWGGSPPHGQFVSFDQRLNAAAQREGFVTV
ncbi:MAG TPA: type II toxin-antitoxin system VapC family toxin [Gemmatimonadaceae bacterium]